MRACGVAHVEQTTREFTRVERQHGQRPEGGMARGQHSQSGRSGGQLASADAGRYARLWGKAAGRSGWRTCSHSMSSCGG